MDDSLLLSCSDLFLGEKTLAAMDRSIQANQKWRQEQAIKFAVDLDKIEADAKRELDEENEKAEREAALECRMFDLKREEVQLQLRNNPWFQDNETRFEGENQLDVRTNEISKRIDESENALSIVILFRNADLQERPRKMGARNRNFNKRVVLWRQSKPAFSSKTEYRGYKSFIYN